MPKNCVCRSNGVACGKRRKKTLKKIEKALKTSKIKITKNGKQTFLPIAISCWVENCDLKLGNRQTEKQRQRQPFQGFRSSSLPSLQPIIKERSKTVFF